MKIKQLTSKWTVLAIGVSLVFSACSGNSEKSESTSADQTEEHAGSGHDMSASGSNNKMMDLMHDNMNDMQKIKLTGDPDRDFALLMATHHNGALDMAKEEADSGQDTMLVDMAKKTLQTQQDEMDRLERFADAQKSAKGDTSKTMQMMAPMKDMMAKMNHDMKGGIDHHFASLMSMHHQSGIDMAKAYMPQAKSAEIKAMAQKIIDEQQREKQKLDDWLLEHQQ
ncbi:DUF305 domain-containing protein [Rufibacter sp. LB8]|nr:DUF305 domain-containing protein [Rufibacter sp. LB8]